MTNSSQDPSKSLMWLVNHLQEDGKTAKRVIVYTVNLRQCENLFMWLTGELREHAYTNPQSPSRSTRLIEMVHSKTDDCSLQRILKLFLAWDQTCKTDDCSLQRILKLFLAWDQNCKTDDCSLQRILKLFPAGDIRLVRQMTAICSEYWNSFQQEISDL